MNITREEVLKIAEISRLTLHKDEVDQILKQLEAVLEYAQRVKDLAGQDTPEDTHKNINIMREDKVVASDPEIILSCAPEREENFFVVPRILDSK